MNIDFAKKKKQVKLSLSVVVQLKKTFSVSMCDKKKNIIKILINLHCHTIKMYFIQNSSYIQVASDCTSVYVDGAESRGSHNVTIIVKSGHTTAFMDIAVWVPEERPYLQLSDDKLSRVRKWRVPSGSTRLVIHSTLDLWISS